MAGAAPTAGGGVYGRLVEPVLALILRRLEPNALDGFKDLIEPGACHIGKALKLPLAPVL
jgi:hypothetical protein